MTETERSKDFSIHNQGMSLPTEAPSQSGRQAGRQAGRQHAHVSSQLIHAYDIHESTSLVIVSPTRVVLTTELQNTRNSGVLKDRGLPNTEHHG